MQRFFFAATLLVVTVASIQSVKSLEATTEIHLKCEEFTRTPDGIWMTSGPSISLSDPQQKTKDVYFNSLRRSFSEGDIFMGLNIAAILNERCQ